MCIASVQVDTENTHESQPACPPRGVSLLRLPCPLESKRNGDVGSGVALEVAHEVAQKWLGTVQLESERPPQHEVGVELIDESAHASPPIGQGRTKVASAFRSTLA